MTEILIYGATGYTGRLIADQAVAAGLRPVLAGRNAATLRTLAGELGLEHRIFGLDDADALRRGLQGIGVVLHAAGPFSATSRPVAEACIASGVHYCDITGEIDVFEALAARGPDAAAAGVMLLPGVGFDVVPSDCLAAHVAARLPDATRLHLSIGGLTRASRGTAKTMVEGIAQGARIRSGGRIVTVATPRSTADFGEGPRPTVGVAWGDVSTAWHTTGIPDLSVFFEADRTIERAAAMPGLLKGLIGTRPVQRFLKRQVDQRLPPGPTPDQRARGRACVVAEARNDAGRVAASRLVTPEPYTLTAMTAVAIAQRIGAGAAQPGFATPAGLFGADFILQIPGVTRLDL